MNYDKLANMKIKELRKHCLEILQEYVRVTGEKITATDIGTMPKARLLYIAVRFEVESDVRVQPRNITQQKEEEIEEWAITLRRLR